MKLRNKKTGEIGNLLPYGCEDGKMWVWVGNISRPEYRYNSLAELNEEWEDYEEPKGYYYINTHLHSVDYVDNTYENKGKDQEIGNYFETKEEAEKAVEKLKAWKRLKDNGFKFDGWERDERYCGDFTITATDQTSCDDKDLDLLFGGEE